MSSSDEIGVKFPLFTGFYNGLGVEVKTATEISMLYKWGCFGKGSQSRSKPYLLKEGKYKQKLEVLRKRQFAKREEWVKKFIDKYEPSIKEKNMQSELEEIISQIKDSTEGSKNVIDLVSSDEEIETADVVDNRMEPIPRINPECVAVVVPNSDSEEEDYFKNFKPKCCFNKVKIKESLVLSLQEAYFLSYAFGCLQIVDQDRKPMSLEESWKKFVATEENFISKYIVYHYFRTKGYVVKPGIKFGGDYLLYKEGPGHGHANYIVVIKNCYDNCNWLQTMGHIRMAGTTSKEIMLAEIMPDVNTNDLITPQEICKYSVREAIWDRKIHGHDEE